MEEDSSTNLQSLTDDPLQVPTLSNGLTRKRDDRAVDDEITDKELVPVDEDRGGWRHRLQGLR
jgi:hypothetical protein